MQRRDVLKLLASTAVISAIPTEAMHALQEARTQAAAIGGLRTLNAHQNATVVTLAELIIPATDTPGATGAKVNEFIDLLLTEWYDKPDAEFFLQGLAEVDARSRKLYGKAFVDCNATQQNHLMKLMDDEAMLHISHQEPARPLSAIEIPKAKITINEKPTAPPKPQNFFLNFKKLTLFGYYTSEIGFKQELGKSIIPPTHAGCAPMEEMRK